jgi:nicotinate-nucleotide pyrophosphorylase (carboxylating)
LNWEIVDPIVERALGEDIGAGDFTTDSIIAAGVQGTGSVTAKQDGVLAGLPVFVRVFHLLDPNTTAGESLPDGSEIRKGRTLGTIRGAVRTLLKGERTALNFLQRLSGIATLTRAYADAVAGTGAKILDTRKTTPNLRILEKYAVRAGGGENHRFGLDDMILIKNNHIDAAGGLSEAVTRCLSFLKAQGMRLKITVEARTLAEVDEALRHPVHRIMLDNMSPPEMREAVRLISGRTETEASGNIRLDHVRAVAESGVDFISVGALTHSAPSLDLSFRIEVLHS